MNFKKEKEEIISACQNMHAQGLVINTSGNISIRTDRTVLITPNATAYDNLSKSAICEIDLDTGKYLHADFLPSSELPLHLAIYRVIDTRAIVHTHPVYGTALSTVVEELPAIHYQIADLGGPVPVTRYETFGTEELAQVVAEALSGRTAVLMRNHGATTIGENLAKALGRSFTLEWLCQVYWLASVSGTPSLLSEGELGTVAANQKHLAAERMERFEDARLGKKIDSDKIP